MVTQASEKYSLLLPTHHRIAFCTSNGINSEQVPGSTFSVLKRNQWAIPTSESGTSQDGKRNGSTAGFTRAGSSPRSRETERLSERTEIDPSSFCDKCRVEEPKKTPAGIVVRIIDGSLKEPEAPDRPLESMMTGPALDVRMGEGARKGIV